MKKILFLLLATITLIGCSKSDDKEQSNELVGTEWVYGYNIPPLQKKISISFLNNSKLVYSATIKGVTMNSEQSYEYNKPFIKINGQEGAIFKIEGNSFSTGFGQMFDNKDNFITNIHPEYVFNKVVNGNYKLKTSRDLHSIKNTLTNSHWVEGEFSKTGVYFSDNGKCVVKTNENESFKISDYTYEYPSIKMKEYPNIEITIIEDDTKIRVSEKGKDFVYIRVN